MVDARDACALLRGTRVVELAGDVAVPYAGRLLADMGAHVTKVEPPAGDPVRYHGPFPDERRSPDESGLFHILNAGKDGAVLDPVDDRTGTNLEAVVDGADVVLVGAGSPFGELLGPLDELVERRPDLVVGHVSAVAPDTGALVAMDGAMHTSAVAGNSMLVGEADRAPLVPPFDVLNYLTGANFAAAVLAALVVRDRTGWGQLVEIYEQELVEYGNYSASFILPPGVANLREGRRFPGSGGPYPFGIFPCKDGQVALVGRTRENWRALLAMIGSPAWGDDPRFEDPVEIGLHHADEVDALIAPHLLRYTRAELFDLGQKHAVAVGPLLTVPEVIGHEQFRQRGMWSDEIPVGGIALRFARRPYTFARTPIPAAIAPAPPLTAPDPAGPTTSGAVVTTRDRTPDLGERPRRALHGIRVVDFTWAFAGPMVASTLADLGAEVIKIEHRKRLDNARLRARPVREGKPLEGPVEEVSLYFHQNNRGKASAGIDIKDPVGRELVEDLMARSHVVVDNLSAGVFERAGLGYDVVARRNPALVWLSMSAIGKTGPLARARGYAPIMTSIAGLEALTGYEGEEPIGGIGTAYGDINGAAHGIVAVLAALRHARRTGEGQFIDLSQTEATVAVLGEPIAEYLLTGTTPRPRGMHHRRYVPYGNYPCREGEWVALWVTDDEEWSRLVTVIGEQALPDQVDATSRADVRMRAHQDIDRAISAWTARRSREEAASTLRSAGVRAAPLRSADEARDAWRRREDTPVVEHPVTGREEVFTAPWRMSRTPLQTRSAAPLVGQDTQYVLEQVLGLPIATVDELLASGAVEGPLDAW